MQKSYIYIISNGTDLKVGLSKYPLKRLKQLQTGSSDKLELVESYAVPKTMVHKLESQCHKHLQKIYTKRGEWFKEPLLWDVKCTIESICDGQIIYEKEE